MCYFDLATFVLLCLYGADYALSYGYDCCFLCGADYTLRLILTLLYVDVR
jgi:hypothetical protein